MTWLIFYESNSFTEKKKIGKTMSNPHPTPPKYNSLLQPI